MGRGGGEIAGGERVVGCPEDRDESSREEGEEEEGRD